MVISHDEVYQWTPTLADAWKDQERSLPSWQRRQQQLPETVILCDIRSLMQISKHISEVSAAHDALQQEIMELSQEQQDVLTE